MPTRAGWDARYKGARGLLPPPDPFLREALPLVRGFPKGSGVAADIAAGSGRHSMELASWGFRTLAIDYSEEGLRTCERYAKAAGLTVETLCVDLEDADLELGEERFDVLAVFNFLHRPLIPSLRRATRRGGFVIYKTFTVRQLALGTGPRNPKYLLAENELPELFSGFRQIVYRETCESEGTAALVAQRY